MMNKQEFQKTIQNMEPPKHFSALTFKEAFNEGFNSAINNVLFNSCFLDTPEKPVVPRCVADWYEDNEDSFEFNLYTLCLDYNNCEVDKKLSDWFCDKHNKPLETLVNMHQFGYEVEKEKLYTVEIPNPNGLDYLMLQKDRRGKISVAWYCTDRWREDERVRLTEAEIKQDFEWAWQFAKEVEYD